MLIKVTKEILYESSFCPVLIPGQTASDFQAKFIRGNCAISNAVREVFPLAETFRNCICPFGLMGVSEIRLPQEASEFISQFDFARPEKRIEMQPISFEIEVPQEVIDKIGIEEVTRILSESKTLELVGETIGEN